MLQACVEKCVLALQLRMSLWLKCSANLLGPTLLQVWGLAPPAARAANESFLSQMFQAELCVRLETACSLPSLTASADAGDNVFHSAGGEDVTYRRKSRASSRSQNNS